ERRPHDLRLRIYECYLVCVLYRLATSQVRPRRVTNRGVIRGARCLLNYRYIAVRMFWIITCREKHQSRHDNASLAINQNLVFALKDVPDLKLGVTGSD